MNDITIVARNKTSLEKILNHIADYGEATGACLNKSKSVLLAIGE